MRAEDEATGTQQVKIVNAAGYDVSKSPHLLSVFSSSEVGWSLAINLQ